MPDSPWSLFSPFSQTFGKFVNEPITSWQRFFNPQLVFNYNPQDEPVEAHVLSRVGSYGSQISTLIDMIDLLQRRLLPAEGLEGADLETLKAFDALRDTANQAVDEFRGRVSADDIVTAAKALRKRDPGGAQALRERLDAALDAD